MESDYCMQINVYRVSLFEMVHNGSNCFGTNQCTHSTQMAKCRHVHIFSWLTTETQIIFAIKSLYSVPFYYQLLIHK